MNKKLDVKDEKLEAKGSKKNIENEEENSSRKNADDAGEKMEKVESKDKKQDVKDEQDSSKKDTKKAEKKIYDKAVANGFGLRISPKYSKYVCRMIKGKSVEAAVKRLQEVLDEKRPVPMAGLEVGHKKGEGLSGAKFPKNCCKVIVEIVKQAGANAAALEIENGVITQAISNSASAPFRRGGRKGKRAHIYIEIKDKVKMMEAKK